MKKFETQTLPVESDAIDGSPRFSAKAIRKAIVALEPILGRASVDALIDDFQKHGLKLTLEKEKYSLLQIQDALEKIFGVESGSILFTRLTRELFKQ